MKCNNCNMNLLPTLKNKGPHIGAYCSFCGKWIKWLDKEEKLKYVSSNGESYSTLTGKAPEVITEDNDDGEVPW